MDTAIKASLERWRNHLKTWSAGESGRLFLWAPAAIGAGAALYLSLGAEPPPVAAPLIALLAGAFSVMTWRGRTLARAILLIAAGFALADLRTTLVAAPQLGRELNPRDVTGVLLAVDESPSMRRLIIEPESVSGLDPSVTPRRARLSWRGKEFDAQPGQRISLRASLTPPPAPSVPGGFDYGRQLYFQKIGALGYAVTAPTVLEGPKTLGDKARAAIENARLALTRRILAAAPGDDGALLVANITGKRGALSEQAEAKLRDSGLAHLIAISGLNMALATGIFFFTLRFLFALIPAIALRYPVKKWAAGAALLGGFAYLLISGGDWSAIRAFIMTSIFFIAILLDRRALSLRNVAVAALIILVFSPEAVIHPGFQMSFAAVTALIAAYEWHSKRLDPDRSFSPWARFRRYFAGVAATDMIASTATSPFALYHFNRAAVFGLPANIVSIPIMGFWVMPVAMVALLAMPFGLDAPFWKLAAGGVEVILHVGAFVAAVPGSTQTIPQWPPFALVALTLGGLWLCLQTARWRLAGLAALPIAGAAIAFTTTPDIFVGEKGDNAAIVIHENGRAALAMLHPRKDKFEATVWKEHSGLDPERSETRALSDIGRCDAAGCVVALKGRRVAFSDDPLDLAEDCARADIVIASFPAPKREATSCAARLIDRRAAWTGGALAITIGRDGSLGVAETNALRGARPWSIAQRPSRPQQEAPPIVAQAR